MRYCVGVRFPSIISRILIASTLLLLCGGLFVFGVNVWMVDSAKPREYSDLSALPSKQAILILGTRVYAGNVSQVLKGRLDVAIGAYTEKKAGKFLVSGDHGGKYYDEVNTMKQYLLQAGVPSADIFMDHAGFSTYESLYRARDIFGVQSVIIATQGFHLPRALFIARSLGIDAVGLRAEESDLPRSIIVRNALREPFARMKAFWDVLRGAKPTVLGAPIPLSGDGSVTEG